MNNRDKYECEECSREVHASEGLEPLKECPFCGKPARLWPSAVLEHMMASCPTQDCPAQRMGALFVEDWNRRSRPAPPQAAITIIEDLRLQAGIAEQMRAMGDAASMERAADFIEREWANRPAPPGGGPGRQETQAGEEVSLQSPIRGRGDLSEASGSLRGSDAASPASSSKALREAAQYLVNVSQADLMLYVEWCKEKYGDQVGPHKMLRAFKALERALAASQQEKL